MLFLLILLILLISYMLDKILRKRLNIEKDHFIYKHAITWQKWIEILLVVVCLVAMYTVGVVWEVLNPVYFIWAFMGVLWGFRAFCEWKYQNKLKKYIPHALVSIVCLLIFGLITLYALPKDTNITVHGFMYSDNGEVVEPVRVQIAGTITPNIIYEDSVKGQLTINDTEFLLIAYPYIDANNPINNIINQIKGSNRLFTLIDINGRAEGEASITRDYQVFMGEIEGLSVAPSIPIKFTAPAETVEEAQNCWITCQF